MKKKTHFCSECFETLNPNKNNCIAFGDECGLSSINHKPPCGDGCNEDSSPIYPLKLEAVLESAKERKDWYKELFSDVCKDWDDMRKILGIDLTEGRRLINQKDYKKEVIINIKKKIIEKLSKDLEEENAKEK
jgi:hypothetical protein